MTCKTSSILDYSTKENKNFFSEYDFDNREFDKYRKGNHLVLASIVRPDYDSYRLYLSLYSTENLSPDILIKKVEIRNESEILFSKDINTKITNMPVPDKNGLFVTDFVLFDSIPQREMPKTNYIVTLYFEDGYFKYNFFPIERKYLVSVSL